MTLRRLLSSFSSPPILHLSQSRTCAPLAARLSSTSSLLSLHRSSPTSRFISTRPMSSSLPTLRLFRQVWGCDLFSVDPPVLFPELSRLGYHGLEASIADIRRLSHGKVDELLSLLRQHRLDLICIAYTRWNDYQQWEQKSVEEQLAQYEEQLNVIKQWQPVHVNTHAGDDTWTMKEHLAFFERALPLQQRILGPTITASFETHRGRSLSTPAVGLQLMHHLPELRLTADLSHWVLVSERLFTHQIERDWMERVVARVDHTHARAGYAQHAQVPHPSWAGFEKEEAWFDEWWQRIWDESKKAGKRTITLTPEIGPVPYTMTQKDGSPVVDAWDYANTEKDRIERLYKQWAAKQTE